MGFLETVRPVLRGTKKPCDVDVHRSVDELPEKRVIAPLKRAINARDDSAFMLSLRKFFKNECESNKLGSALHKIRMQDLDTVMHEAARVKGATSILMIICNYAPFLMGQPNSIGLTVWHIAAQNKHSFKILYDRRQSLKKQLEEAGTPKMSLHGVEGGMEDLSIKAANNRNGNTALHQALLSNNKQVAEMLFDADKELCYLVNGEKKSPMHLALENGHVDFFKSMFEFAASSSDKISDFDAQKKSLLKIANARGHSDQIINLISGDNSSEDDVPLVNETSRSSYNRENSRYVKRPLRRKIKKGSKRGGHVYKETSDQTYVILYSEIISAIRKAVAFRKSEALQEISMFVFEPDRYHSDSRNTITQLLFLLVLIFILLVPFIFVSMPTFQLFYAINGILCLMVFLGIAVLAVARHSRNFLIGQTNSVLLQIYLRGVFLMFVLELAAGLWVVAYELKLVTIVFASRRGPIVISYKGVPFFILRR